MYHYHNYSGTSNKEPSEEGTTSLQRTLPIFPTCICNTFSTSENRTTSLQRTKWLVPNCPLLGGSTLTTICCYIVDFQQTHSTNVMCFPPCRGRYGILHRCVDKNNGTVYCAKYLKQTELAMNEVKTLHGLCRGKMCDNLVQWMDALSTENNIVIIMEL